MQNDLELKLSQSMSAVFHDMQDSVSFEVAAIRSQTDQIKLLLTDAIASLHDAFASIHNASDQQMDAMSALMMQVTGSEDESIFQKSEQASDILSTLVDTLVHSSKNNLHALTTMDVVQQRMQAMVSTSAEIEAMNEKLLSYATSGNVNTETMRRLLTELHQKQTQQTEYAIDSVAKFRETHRLIDEIASKDMDEVFASKAKVEDILQHFFQINTIVADSSSTVSRVNTDIRKHLGTAIRALQFEDISSQSLGHTDRHLDRMEGVLSILTDGLKGLETSDMTLEIYVSRIAAIHVAMMSYHQKLQLENSNPISQENMDEGDVDLF